MKRKWIGTVALALALTASLAVSAMAQPGGGFGPGRAGHFKGRRGGRLLHALKELDLTDEQKTQIRALMKKHRPEFITIVKALRDKHRAVADLATADRIDEAAIRDAAADMADAIADGALLRARVRAEAKSILTREQLKKWDALRQRMRDRVDEFFNEAGDE